MTANEIIQQIYDKFDNDMLDKQACIPLVRMAGRIDEFNSIWKDDLKNPFDQPIGWDIGEFLADCITTIQK